jgi:anionic cell wall polymer biosynthesis LytR-Cps2A-Psr (LCP) family protein
LGDALRGVGRGEERRSQGQAASQQPYYPQQQSFGQQGYPQQYGYPEQPAYQEEPRRRPHRARNVLLAVLAVIVGLYLLICVPIDRSIAFSDDVATSLSGELSMHVPLTPYYVLALGSDAREGDTVSRTDTMILCRIDPLAAKVTMVSIPRDTMVQIDGHGTQKINAAYAFGGAAGAVKAVKSLTGASVNHVALVHFDGIEALVNALGGVTVDVPVDVNDPGYTGSRAPCGHA